MKYKTLSCSISIIVFYFESREKVFFEAQINVIEMPIYLSGFCGSTVLLKAE